MTGVQADTDLLRARAREVAAGQNRIGGAWRSLSGALGSCGGMAGNPAKDQAAARFITAYTPAVQAAWQGFAALHLSVGDMSRGLDQTAENHLRADRDSSVGERFSMFPQQGSFMERALGFTVSGPLNLPDPPPASGPGQEPPKSLLETLFGIEIELFDVSEYWPTADSMALMSAAEAWKAAHDGLIESRGPVAAAAKAVTDHSDAPDVDAFGGYWKKVYTDCAPGTLYDGLPRLCGAISTACADYAEAVMRASTQMNGAAANPIAVVVQAVALRAAMATAARALLQTVGGIAVGSLGYQLVTSVSTGAGTAPTVRVLQAETEPNGKYVPGGKHKNKTTRARRGGENSKEPEDGQEALDNSVSIKPTTDRRVGYDAENDEIVVLDKTSEGVFHGHVRTWKGLDQEMQNALVRSGLFNRRGKYIGGS